ncbi:hypothetical protein ACIBCP_35715 [Streptomyces sp. NPDC051287]|uniref:hypothetical protein n=1 Tax=Streptomyces sp. NPDC051287 TaxID=3365648 RepID=UPI0037B44CCE
MTPIASSIGAFALLPRALAATGLATLALAGCGTSGSTGSGPEGEPGRSVGTRANATPSTPEQAAFAAMLDKVAQPCASAGEDPSGPAGEEPTGPAGQESLAPGESPPLEPVEPGAPTEYETRLSERDRCASVQHEQRIIQALQAVADPTPATVRKSLNGLGYIDERIHGLTQNGRTTRFYLDLREEGGRLCEAGVAAGEESDVTTCSAPATGSFTVDNPPSDRM